MALINKFVFGTMSIENKKDSIDLMNYALKNFNFFHISSEYKSFKTISKIIKEKKN